MSRPSDVASSRQACRVAAVKTECFVRVIALLWNRARATPLLCTKRQDVSPLTTCIGWLSTGLVSVEVMGFGISIGRNGPAAGNEDIRVIRAGSGGGGVAREIDLSILLTVGNELREVVVHVRFTQ